MSSNAAYRLYNLVAYLGGIICILLGGNSADVKLSSFMEADGEISFEHLFTFS